MQHSINTYGQSGEVFLKAILNTNTLPATSLTLFSHSVWGQRPCHVHHGTNAYPGEPRGPCGLSSAPHADLHGATQVGQVLVHMKSPLPSLPGTQFVDTPAINFAVV